MHKFATRLLLASLSLLFFAAQTSAQAKIQFQISYLKSPSAIIGYYYAGDMYRRDSVSVDTLTGRFQLTQPSLTPGLYFVGAGGTRLFDFVVASPTDSFSVRGSMARLDSLMAEGSAENSAFFQFERKRKAIEALMAAKRSLYEMVQRATQNDPEALQPLRQEMQKLIQDVDALGRDFQRQHPTHLYARMLRSIEVPEAPQKVKTSKNAKAGLIWAQTHYFDNTNWRDSTLLRNNMWPVFFGNFFNRLIAPQADSIIAAADHVLKKMPKNGPFYRFAVLNLTSNFEQSAFPAADRIFVHMVDFYQKKDDTPWLDAATLLRLEYKAEVHRPTLTGTLAPALQLPDDADKMVSLHSIEAPMTMLVFYSPLCEHCQKSMPGIYQTWLDYRKTGLQAIAVNTDDQHQHWKQFVAQQGWEWIDLADTAGKNEAMEKNYGTFNLPVIYILDKDKKVLRKRVVPEHLVFNYVTSPASQNPCTRRAILLAR